MALANRETEGRRVGELAAATGLTVRALHYYEEIGLLVASGRTGSGHRRYADADVERLYRICLLRRLKRGVTPPALHRDGGFRDRHGRDTQTGKPYRPAAFGEGIDRYRTFSRG